MISGIKSSDPLPNDNTTALCQTSAGSPEPSLDLSDMHTVLNTNHFDIFVTDVLDTSGQIDTGKAVAGVFPISSITFSLQ